MKKNEDPNRIFIKSQFLFFNLILRKNNLTLRNVLFVGDLRVQDLRGKMGRKGEEPSRHEIWKMFDEISSTYDKVNRVMTFGLDRRWRDKLSNFLPEKKKLSILDCATGTGDQILSILRCRKDVYSVIGVDLAKEMLEIGRVKMGKALLAKKVSFQVADALSLPFQDHTFDCVTISFGIRNVTDVEQALKEFYRVLKVGGAVLILEGTVPTARWLQGIHLAYLRYCLPWIGGVISKNRNAYRYLNQTIETFPQGKAFCRLLQGSGFSRVKAHPLMKGVATIYQGEKV